MSDRREIRHLPKPVDVENALLEAVQLLERHGQEGALIGGVALAVHGVERFTKDVDLAVTLATAGVMETHLQQHDLKPLRIGGISWASRSGVRVDFIDHRFEFRALYEEAITAAKESPLRVQIGSSSIYVVPLTYLVAMKLGSGRPFDERDLVQLLLKPELDYQAARTLVERHLGIYAAKQLDKFAREAGRNDAPKDYSNEPS